MAIPGNMLSATTESIEPNASGWRAKLNCTLGLGTGGRNGPNTLAVRATAAGEVQAETAAAYPVAPTETYFTFADAASGAVPERIGIRWLDAAGAEISITWSMTTASASGSLHRVSVAGVAPDLAATARVVLSSTETAAGALHYWENVYLGAPIRTTGNLLPFNVESGGELSTSGWTVEANSTVTRTAPAQHWPATWYLAGGHLIAMTAAAAGDASMRCTERATATAGTEYRGYAYLGPRAAGMQPWIEMRFYDGAGALLLAKRATLAPPGVGMYRQMVSGAAPAGTEACEVAVGLTGASAGQVLWVEGVVIAVAPQLAAGTVVPYEDGSFEQGVGQWTVASGPATLARTSPWGSSYLDGFYALAVTSATTGTTILHSGRYPVQELLSWRAAFNARRTAGSWTIDLGVRWFGATGAELGFEGYTGAVTLPIDGLWRTYSDDMTAPAGAATGRIELQLTATAASSTAHIDQVSLRQALPRATVEPDPELARITLTLRELTAGQLITVWRVGEDGQRTLVRGPGGMLERALLESDILVVEDYEAPLGTVVQYYVETYNATTGATLTLRWTDPATLDPGDGNYVWLKDPSLPHRNLRVLVQSAPEWTRPIAQAEYRVRGRRNPVVLSDVRGGLAGSLAAWTESDEQRHALHWLLDSGNPLLLQAAPGYGVEDVYVTVGEVTEARTGGTAREPWRAWTLPLTAVDMPTAVGVAGTAGWSGYDVLAMFASGTAVLDAYLTGEALMMGPPGNGG